MKNIYLVGFMGTGKTVVGKQLAKRLNLKFLDLDSLIEKKEGRAIKDIFTQNGEFYFRTLEKEAVEGICKEQSLVVACGGGVVVDKDNLENLKRTGTVVCLTARAEIILARCKGHIHRPLLNVENPIERIKELLAFRAPFYAQAHFCLDTSDISVEEVVEKISERLRNYD